jgi:thiol-disulfide isomerase/thioredoxin
MKNLILLLTIGLVVTACSPGAGDAVDETSESPDSTVATTTTFTGESFAGTVDAPEFPDGLDWINTAQPLTLDGLKGKVVLLDFWTYGCVNCIHIIPDLERLEEEYPDELVVIGVHSAKFTNEGETSNLRDIVQRYGIGHPVVNDRDFQVWDAWGANAWPTVALIDPSSRAVGIRAGEGVYEAFEPVIAGLVAEFDANGALNRDQVEFALEADAAADRPLNYPGKVLAVDGRLFVSDTGHHRILEVDPSTGDVFAAFGSGRRGSTDGAALEASFNAPQGLTLFGGTLYVADSNNHLVRSIDLDTGEVSTAVGTGQQAWPPVTGTLTGTSLSTPWDVDERNGSLYIANAGTHQIWRADLAFDVVGPLIGSAREGTLNGPFPTAELAQPSSVTISDEGMLYFADSESSSIRVGNLGEEVTALVVGSDQDLFSFGDEDGTGNDARLQHPLGTEVHGDILYVADTYNSKIKRVDLTTNSVSSWLGGEPGWADGSDALFNEPGGLSFDGSTLYVADTNNHSVRMIDVTTGITSTLVLKGVEAFDPPAQFRGEIVTLATTTVAAGQGSLLIDYTLPDGYKVNEEAPSSVTVGSGSSVVTLFTGDPKDLTGTELPVDVPVTFSEGSATARFDVTIIYCSFDATSLCFIDQVRYEVPLDVGPSGPSNQIALSRTIPAP